jgi:hypothetical protein
LEANILPFFLLLGVYTTTRALAPKTSPLWIVFALVPWGLALYAYAISYLVIPILILGIAIGYRQTILQNFKPWLVSAALFGLGVLPIGLFLLKNFLIHGAWPFEKYLPFSMPLLVSTRIELSSPIPDRWINNFFFILSGFLEEDWRSALVGHPPILLIFLPLALVGMAVWIKEFFSTQRPEFFLVWFIGCIPIFLMIDRGIVHFNSLLSAHRHRLVYPRENCAVFAAPVSAKNFLGCRHRTGRIAGFAFSDGLLLNLA